MRERNLLACLVRRALCMACLVGAATGAAREPVSFQLASLDGKRFVSSKEYRGQVALFAFWDDDCPPCLVEVDRLPALASAFPHVRLVTVSLDERATILKHAAPLQTAGVDLLLAPAEPRGLLRRLGNPHGLLPFSFALSARGDLCATHFSPLDEAAVAMTIAKCKD